MAKIQITTRNKTSPEPEPEEPEANENEAKSEEVKELASKVASDVSTAVKERPERLDPDEDLDIEPDKNYPKIALLRVSVGDDDERTMDEWTEAVKEALKDAVKNATILTKHRLVNGKQVSNHRYEEEID